MSTASSLILLALKDIGVLDEIETPSSAIMDDALTTLNQMIAQWQTERIYIYAQQDITFIPTGVETYTIGTGGVINVATPTRIDYAFLRLSNIDYPVEIFNTFEEYQLGIAYKPVVTIPDSMYFNPTYPLGTIYLYPRPSTGTMHLGMSSTLPVYTALTDTITLPGEYDFAIRLNLGEILSDMMGRGITDGQRRRAAHARKIVRRAAYRSPQLDIGTSGNGPLARILSGG
jgi:hypothetical protein